MLDQEDTSKEELTCVVFLPGLSSADDAELQVSARELRVSTSRPPHAVCVPLACCVDVASCRARWSKRTEELTVRLRKRASNGSE